MRILTLGNGERCRAPFSIAMLLLLVLLSSCGEKKLSYTSQETKVSKMDLAQVVTVAGKLAAVKIASIVAPYDGYVRKIFVEIGQQVKRNQPVISISTNLNESSGFFPMLSPFDGKVTQVATKEGQYVIGRSSNSKTLLQIEDTSKFELEVEVPELDLPKLQVGQEAKIKLASIPGSSFPGKVKSISLSPKESEKHGWGDDSQSRYLVAIELLEQSNEFKSGLSATVDIQSASKKNVLALPGEFLTEYQGAEAVRLKDGKFQKIKIGLRTDNSFEVTEGLKEGDTVVMDELLNAR